MTNIPPSAAGDDPVDRAADALRRASVPEGPPEETITRTLSALQAANEAKTILFPKKGFRRYGWKIAVAGALAASLAVYVTGLLPPRPPLAFAEIAAKLRDARTITYEVTTRSPKQKEPVKMKVFFKDPGWMRSEGAGQVTITDLVHGKGLVLDSASKTAMLIDFEKGESANRDKTSMIEELRKLADKKGESVGQKRIGDLEATGFRVEEEGLPLTVWANPKTKMPVLIETTLRAGDEEILITMSNFQLDPKLEDALFRLEAPEGYQLRKMEMNKENPEESLVHLLRAYAEKSGGKFPASLKMTSSEWQTYLKNRWGEKKSKGLPEPDLVQFMQQAVRVGNLLRKHKDHGYKPEGVKLGDRTKILFWYRPDKSDKYRAVFGDLHVEDVSAKQLPQA